MNFIAAIMIMIAPHAGAVGHESPEVQTEVNYDDPNLAQASGFASDANTACAKRGAESASAVEACLNSYGIFGTEDLSRAVMVVKTETNRNSSSQSSTAPEPAPAPAKAAPVK